MPKQKKKSSRQSRRPAASHVRHDQRTVLAGLARELHALVGGILSAHGVSRREQSKSFGHAMKGTSSRPSAKLMRTTNALSDLLSTWHRDKRYLSREGVPRVLPIRGRGATLESLARRFVPNTPINEVVSAICKQGEVTKRRDNKVALVGSTFINTPKTTDIVLASIVTRFRRIATTILHNAALELGANAWFERQVQGQLPDAAFERYVKILRPQFADLCDRAESGLNVRAPSARHRKDRTCGIGIYVFRDDGSSHSVGRSRLA